VEKDDNIVSKSNDFCGEEALDALSNDNVGPLAMALRQHIKLFYPRSSQEYATEETTQSDDR
jgi:hypothetical protein